MPTVFSSLANDVQCKLGAPYSAGSGTVTLATSFGTALAAAIAAAGFAAISSSAPLRFSLVHAGAASGVIFTATGLSGDALSGVTAVEGTADQAFATGDTFAVLLTAGQIEAIQAAINALEEGGSSMAIGTTISGATASYVLTVGAGGVLAQSTLEGLGAVIAAGVSGGQTVAGDTQAAGNLLLESSTNSTKGHVEFNSANTFVGPAGAFFDTGGTSLGFACGYNFQGPYVGRSGYAGLIYPAGNEVLPCSIGTGDTPSISFAYGSVNLGRASIPFNYGWFQALGFSPIHDSSAPSDSVYLSLDHLDGNGDPKLVRKGATAVTVIG